MNTLVSVDQLDIRHSIVFDCRSTLLAPMQGQKDYEAGHIPGARFADLDRHLSSEPGKRGRHPLPEKEALAAFLESMGVSDDSTVVCYDQNSGAFAARLWWLLRWLGHDGVSVLDGGLDAWIAAGGDLQTDIPETTTGSFSIRPPLTRCFSADELLVPGRQLIDARDIARFRGEAEPIDKVAGHIPGAVCRPFTDNLSHGRFKSAQALKARFQDIGDDAVCYCGSGVTATHNILAACIAGLPEPALYAGSWSEWIEDPARPVATGDE